MIFDELYKKISRKKFASAQSVTDATPSIDSAQLFPKVAAVDLEVDKSTGVIRSIGAIRRDQEKAFHWGAENPWEGVRQLSEYLADVDLVVGHNLEDFDLSFLEIAGDLSRRRRHFDTLWLAALAWPEPRSLRLKKIGRKGLLGAAEFNDPVQDARAALQVFDEGVAALDELWQRNPNLGLAIHACSEGHPALSKGFVFSALRGSDAPTESELGASIDQLAEGRLCSSQVPVLHRMAKDQEASLPFILTRLAVNRPGAGLSPWVRRRFPSAQDKIEELRGNPCVTSRCTWCKRTKDVSGALERWFGHIAFRPKPTTSDGRPMQEAIVQTVFQHEDVLGILPTGTGKSVCYQLPALERHANLDQLTVIISPLVALMSDQRDGLLRNHNIDSCVVINGTLSPLHRQEALDQVAFGEASMLLIAPEQLRNTTVRNVLDNRRIGLWVFDEAHCISKWGHDFRPDYRYAVRLLSDLNGDQAPPQVLCVTATAKKSVVEDICEQISDATGREIVVFDGGAKRSNLKFDGAPVTKMSKLGTVCETVSEQPSDQASLVYCSTRRETERLKDALRAIPIEAEAYHAGLGRDVRQRVLDQYLSGELQSIAATNAFGMGVDKPDIRLVIHADIPASLENYLQEAGRAGRDGATARCTLLHDPSQLEAHFRRQAQNRLTRREIARVLKTLREMNGKFAKDGELVVQIDDLMRRSGIPSGHEGAGRTRILTALAWLEEAGLLTRGANRVTVEPSCLRVDDVAAAEAELLSNGIGRQRLKVALSLVTVLLEAAPSSSFTIEDLGDLIGRSSWQVRDLLRDLDRIGILVRDTNLVVHVAHGVRQPVTERLKSMSDLEMAMLSALHEDFQAAPSEGVVVNLRRLAQDVRNGGTTDHRPDHLVRLLRSLGHDGRRDLDQLPPITMRSIDRERVHLTLHAKYEDILDVVKRRHAVASLIVSELLERLEKGARGAALPIPVALTDLHDRMLSDMHLRAASLESEAWIVDRALLWMHALDVLYVGSGMFLFSPAVTVRLSEETRKFTEEDFRPLADHYTEQTRQVHIMGRYGDLALEDADAAQELANDYFASDTRTFLGRWLPNMKPLETERPIRPELYAEIVDDLRADDQISIVADDRQETNVLVLAGPGSGKTRVLVHRIAYLLEVKREDPSGILALAYNQHAAHEIRTRLRALVGDGANGVTIRTCHGLALWLSGRSLVGEDPKGEDFRSILREAVRLVESDVEAKEGLLEGYRWILVDEYQDIGPDEYALISAVAGLARSDPDNRRTLFAVGDDDQAIYGFNGASVEYIRRFEEDFDAEKKFLKQNYRSTGHIITSANEVIASVTDRMKVEQPIQIDHARRGQDRGGQLASSDPIGRGRVQVLTGLVGERGQAVATVSELKRLSSVAEDWTWDRAAVIARTWAALDPVRSYCEAEGIPVNDRRETRDRPAIWQLVEYRQLANWLTSLETPMVDVDEIQKWLANKTSGPIWRDLKTLFERLGMELGAKSVSTKDALSWIGGWGREQAAINEGLTLVTAHSAKGLEFDHVVVMDDGWAAGRQEDQNESRRLYYVAMTRARTSLSLLEGTTRHPFLPEGDRASLFRRESVFPEVDPIKTSKLYRRANLKEVHLGFGGNLKEDTDWYRALTSAQTGDQIRLVNRSLGGRRRWELEDGSGAVIGAMAKAFDPPKGYVCERARIAWMVNRSHDPSGNKPFAQPVRDEWPVAVPEFVFVPEA
jgi:ATP-dependent DNA helicase RecQ